MPVLPDLVSGTVRRIYRLHEARNEREAPRGYLGISSIGVSCARRLWYGFHWCGAPRFDGRMLRLFDSGHREEARVLDELRAIGLEVSDRDDDGRQWSVSACGGHLRGHLDGAVRGLEEAPMTWHVFENKSMNERNFAEVKAKGVQVAQPVHFAQLQGYMGLTGMHRAAYFAVNKNTDEIYLERVHFDKVEFDKLLAKAQAIIDAAEPPARVSEDPSWYECKSCPHHALCHGVAAPPQNCRTCAHSTPFANGQWLCERFGEPVGEEIQRVGCEEHRHQPALVASFLELEAVEAGNVVVWRNKLNGAEVRQPDYSSSEIHAAEDKAFLGDDFLKMVKTQFPGARAANHRPPEETGSAPRSDLENLYGSAVAGAGARGVAHAGADVGCNQRELL